MGFKGRLAQIQVIYDELASSGESFSAEEYESMDPWVLYDILDVQEIRTELTWVACEALDRAKTAEARVRSLELKIAAMQSAMNVWFDSSDAAERSSRLDSDENDQLVESSESMRTVRNWYQQYDDEETVDDLAIEEE